MKKIKLILALVLASSMANAQVAWSGVNWIMPPNNFNTTVDPPTNTSVSSSTNQYFSSNGAFDHSGNLKFYVQDLNIYVTGSSAPSASLPTITNGGGTWAQPGHEIEVVPVPGSCNQYYVIYELNTISNGGGGSYVAYVMVDCSSGSPVMTTPSNNVLSTSQGVGLAVSKTITSGNRYLFTMDGGVLGGMVRYTIGPWNSGVGISSQTSVNPSGTTGYANSICALELSPDQTRLAWNGGTPYGNAVYEITLTSSYGFSSFTTYNIPNVGSLGIIYGLQYGQPTSTTNILFVASTSGITYFTPGPSPTYIVLTTNVNYGKTQLQRMATGNIMGVYGNVASAGQLFEITVGGIPALSLSSNTTPIYSYYAVPSLPSYNIYHLPDGLDKYYVSPVTFSPTVSAPAYVCSGSTTNIVATGNAGNNPITILPDVYSWQIQSCNAAGVPDGVYSIFPVNTTNSSYSFPTSGMPCGHNYLITLTVSKNCPVLYAVSATTQVYYDCTPNPVITGNTTICSGNSTTLCENTYTGSPYSIIWTTPGRHSTIYLGSTPCITESPGSNTTYSVTVTNTVTGCSAIVSQLVTVQNINPQFTLTGTSVSGQSYYTLEATNATYLSTDPTFGYYWGVEEVAVGSTAPYTAIAGSEVDNTPSGCWWILPSNIWFSGYQGGNYTYSTNSSLPCNANYGAGTGIGTFAKGHEYLITYATWSSACPWKTTAQTAYFCAGCRFENEVVQSNLTFENAMGRKKQNNESLIEVSNVSIYPNPNNGNFTIETQAITPQLVEMFDLTGKLILSQTINSTANINVSDLTNGIYNIKISDNNNVTNKRIIVSK
jgi:hypothetical protein